MTPPAEIWLPPGLSRKVTHTCGLCGKPFFEGESVARDKHVVRCATERRQELIDHVEAVEPSGFFKPLDEEYARFIRTGGKPGGATEHI